MRSALLILLLVTTGCATRHAPPSLSSPPQRTPDESWALVLETHVEADGRIDFVGLAVDPVPLEHFVAHVADREPQGIAEYINAYNALAMYNVINTDIKPKDGLGFFVLQAYSVGGRYWNLYDLENKVIRSLDEPRVHFALNCMVRSCPRLTREPYESATLEAQLEAATREFLGDERNLFVDHERRTIYVSRIFDWYAKDFGGSQADVIEFLNRYRDDPIPTDYAILFQTWDWTLNAVDQGEETSTTASIVATRR